MSDFTGCEMRHGSHSRIPSSIESRLGDEPLIRDAIDEISKAFCRLITASVELVLKKACEQDGYQLELFRLRMCLSSGEVFRIRCFGSAFE